MSRLMDAQSEEPTMSSREIAELTGKLHKNVKRDILVMFTTLEIDALNFERIYYDDLNRGRTEYQLNRYYTELLITGYDVKRRAAVIDRWFELEKQVAQPQVPQSFAEALRLAADTQEKLEEAEEQKKLADARRDSLQRTVGTHMHSVSRFARTFKDLNSNRIKADLYHLGYLYRKGSVYYVYRSFYEFFQEKIDEQYGKTEIYPTAAGKALLADLRMEGKLTKLKRYQ